VGAYLPQISSFAGHVAHAEAEGTLLNEAFFAAMLQRTKLQFEVFNDGRNRRYYAGSEALDRVRLNRSCRQFVKASALSAEDVWRWMFKPEGVVNSIFP
jgi:hypothetical protein